MKGDSPKLTGQNKIILKREKIKIIKADKDGKGSIKKVEKGRGKGLFA